MNRWTPENWASWKPFGIGEQRPNNYSELWRALKENKDQLGYAWRILKEGVCDGCALGTAGMTDWTLKGVHLCNIRLRLLRLNTLPAFDPAILGDAASFQQLKGSRLLALGRIPCPLIRKRGDAEFRRIDWDTALDLIAERMRTSAPERLAFYLTSRGTPNESYYAAQKAVRAIGSNNIDNAARICHSPSTNALKGGLGVAASTCSYKDWLSTDLLVFIGSNVANNQPVATKYIHFGKKNGAKVAVVNCYREPGMENYWIPSIPESALFGTKIADRFFMINIGGDIAFLSGVQKHLIERNQFDASFVANHTTGFDELRDSVSAMAWEDLEKLAGCLRAEMCALADMIAEAKKAIFVWSMGVTQHVCGVDNVRSIVNLALLKGYVGRDGCGLMPIRGHSGVQGGAEMGAYATAFPGGLPITQENADKLSATWGFPVPAKPGLTAVEMIDEAYNGNLDALFSVGGNFLEVLPEPDHVASALANIPLRVHMDLVLSSQMFVEPHDTVILLPAMTRYENPGGVTETSTERRVIFSPEVAGPRIAEARPEWRVFADLACRVRPEIKSSIGLGSTQAIRDEIASVVPVYDGIQRLRAKGDQFQYGGDHLCKEWSFPTSDGKAHFTTVFLPRLELRNGAFLMTTRRGKQFNSMIHESKDAITGADRDAVLMNKSDAEGLGFRQGERVVLRANGKEFHGRVYIAPVSPGNIQIHWPEGNVLIPRGRRSPESGIPDYNAVVTVDKL